MTKCELEAQIEALEETKLILTPRSKGQGVILVKLDQVIEQISKLIMSKQQELSLIK